MKNWIKERAKRVWNKLITDKEAANTVRSTGGYVPSKPTKKEELAFIQGYMLGFHCKFSENDSFEFTLTEDGARVINEYYHSLNQLTLRHYDRSKDTYAPVIYREDYKEDDIIHTELWNAFIMTKDRGCELVFKSIKPTTIVIDDGTF